MKHYICPKCKHDTGTAIYRDKKCGKCGFNIQIYVSNKSFENLLLRLNE